jgi:predicted dinucleotide-binding enzyme
MVAALAAPIVEGGHRVVFLSSDEEDATAPVTALAKQLGFPPKLPNVYSDSRCAALP